MRWTISYAFALASLIGCYSPNYSSKPCNDNAGCPPSYFCDTTRPAPGAAGSCSSRSGRDGSTASQDLTAVSDLTSPPPPLVLKEYVVLGKMSFTVGSNLMDLAGSNDAPAFQRSVGDICVAETEVTVADYTKCVQAGICTTPAGKDVGCNYGVSGRESHPINCVELPQAQTFCSWIQRRLPTESEWEYAANGVTSSTGAKYPWAGMGGTFDATKACFNNGGTCPVGTKVRTYKGVEVGTAQPGFYDLAGNVHEWTTSEPCPYAPPGTDLTCNSRGRVVRGGSGFDNDGRVLRSTARFSNAKDASSIDATFTNSWQRNAGFRCFATATPSGSCVIP